MDILQKLLSFFPEKRFFLDNKAIQLRKLYHQVIVSVVQLIVERPEDLQHLARSEFTRCNLVRIGVVYDLVYGCLHTGEWHAVPVEEREVFSILSYLRIIYMLLVAKESVESLNDAIYIADIGIILGSKIIVDQSGTKQDLLTEVASVISAASSIKQTSEPPMKKLKVDKEASESIICEIPILHQPSLEHFGTQHYDKAEPALLRAIIDDWPAMQKWHDPNYLIGLAGDRTVPVEIGSQYSSDDWSQRLVKFRNFIIDNLGEPRCGDGAQDGEKRAYLAQHELFEQIPELRADISVPDYIGMSDVSPRIKAWLVPKGTISPLHTDPSHNLLCQVFGSKTIILASPEDTPNLYPHEHFILSNTSQVDAQNVDYGRFPLARAVRFRRLVLHRGEVLYIPPGWWHYVESLAPSFSVSFWFE